MGRRSADRNVTSFDEPDWVKRGPEPENDFIRDAPHRRPVLVRTIPKASLEQKSAKKKRKKS